MSGEFDGYLEGYRLSILECGHCSLRFSDRLDVPENLYDMIYRHNAVLPGYNRYAGYATAVTRHPRPLDLLASSELAYWYVRDHIVNRSGSDVTVIDFGCGEGYLTYALRQAGIECTGIDISTTTIHRARQRFGHDEWFLTTEEFGALPERQADVVIALELVEHVAEPVRLLKDAIAAVKQDGAVLMTTPNRDASPADSVWDTDLPPVHLLWFNVRSLRELAVRAGCEVSFPPVPESVVKTLRTGTTRDGMWPPPLTATGDPSVAVRRAHSLPWRIRRRVARSLTGFSGFLEQSPFRQIPGPDRPAQPTTLGALFTPRAGQSADRAAR
ncbi:class I SAM-dependent methyltransferase [Plantactinospora sonchi]|uniref:Class I SAM-dependent methyltransferase n=1 Tax=Plantactinospora sonchi TaxID=1544735 RepID=A0ABU7RS23_9ACTN